MSFAWVRDEEMQSRDCDGSFGLKFNKLDSNVYLSVDLCYLILWKESKKGIGNAD